ncbi:MAG: heavy metal translocating P-type ATPase [Bacteroidota bacterium]
MKKLQVKVGGLSCSFCAETIRKAYSRIDAVSDVNVSLAHEEVLIQHDPERVTEAELKDTLRQLGYTVRDPKKVRTFEEEEAELQREKRKLLIAAGFTGTAALLMIGMWLGFRQPWFKWPMMGVALATVFGPGWYILKMAVQSLRRAILNQHVLLEFGAFAGLIGGFAGFFVADFPIADFFAVAVFITTYHILSGYTSLRVRTRASQAVRKLLDLQPPMARVIRDGVEEEVPIEDVQVNDRVRVRPGEHIPVDGEVTDGNSSVDQSLVTGESIPVEKMLGNEVIGGSLNHSGTLVVRVRRIGEESFLQQVARQIEEARALKPGIIQLVDKILKYYVPGVLVFGGLGILIWTVGAWLVTGEMNLTRGVFAALAVLVMGYPCALGMATPLAMIRGGGMAAEKGILMRSGEAFQALKDIKKIVLDKTGTITKGKPQVVNVVPLDGLEVKKVLLLAASTESPSEHPLARAIVEHARGLDINISEVGEFLAVPGRGARATMNGRTIQVGSLRFLREEGVETSKGLEQAGTLEEKGKTVVAVAADGKILGLLAIADTLKEDATEAIRKMKESGLEPVMITGDNHRTAHAVARQVGIEKVMAELMPDEKAAQVRALQAEGYRVAMVGDGINDAPALMQADVGIAIGAGTDIAIESADVVLVGERLSAIVDAYHIGRTSYKKTVQNLVLAFTFNGIGVPLAITGFVHPVWAMIAMAASVSTVLLNSFGGRLIPTTKAKPKKEKQRIVLNVTNMHCEGCVNTMRNALKKKIEDVQVKADLEKQLLTVGFSNRDISAEGVKEILIETGFKPAR